MMTTLSLNMYLGEQLIGELSFSPDEETFSISYTKLWQKNGFAISPKIPLDGSGSSSQISMFLVNLLPENKGLDYLVESLGVSKNNTFALIKSIGLDTTGAICFLPSDIEHRETYFRSIDKSEIILRIEQPKLHPIEVWDGKPRLSVAGVQPKLNVFYDGNQLGLAEGSLCSTHILKFEKHQHIVLNEWITMNLAKAIGMNVASVEIMPFNEHRALLVTRFDRKYDQSKNKVFRQHIIDSCQALGFSVNKKYERNYGSGRDVKHIREGVSFTKLMQLTEQCMNPISAKLDLLQWAFFNLIIGNADAHGKNYSYYLTSKGMKPTPWYDLVNVSLYEEFEQELAMAIDDVFEPDKIAVYQLASFIDDLNLPVKLASQILKKMINGLQNQWQDTIEKIPFNLKSSEIDFINKYKSNLDNQCSRYLSMANNLTSVKLE